MRQIAGMLCFLGLVLSCSSQAQLARYRYDFTLNRSNFVDSIAIEWERGQVLLPVEIGGKTYRFLFDTGAAQAVVYADSPIDGCRPAGLIRSQDATGAMDTVQLVTLPPITLGQLTLTGCQATIHRRPVAGRNIDGIVGFDLINRGLSAKIDVRNRLLILTDRKDFFRNEQAFPADLDFSDVRGQFKVRRAVEIAAAGGHNMIMVGPPGAGKSMIAKRIPTILPPLTLEEALETTKIHSIAGLTNKRQGARGSLIVQRPFRSPHHTITDVALVGGGQNPHPGEISLAHNGVLFLDELPEYKRSALEVMRQPLEDRKITVARAKDTVEYPASFMLVAAMNPCPCGHYGENNPAHPCTCTPAQVHRYLSKISGPLLDRIDIQCEIEAVPYEQLRDTQPGESSAAIRERVLKARAIQNERFRHSRLVHCNAMMNAKMVRQYCALDEECDKLLEFTMTKLGLSARAYDRILKVARTIADIEGAPDIRKNHLLEAISYRSLDRSTWAG